MKWTVATVQDEVVFTVADKRRDVRSLPESFSDGTAFVRIAFEPPYSFLYFTACNCWKGEKKTVVFLCPFIYGDVADR